MLTTGIIILIIGVVVERATTVRTAQLTDRAGGGVRSGDMRYAAEGGAPKWLSAVALLSYLVMLLGLALIVVALVS